MPKINKKNIKIANFLKRKKKNNEEQIIYRTSDSLTLSNDNTNSTNDNESNSTNDNKSNSTNDNKSNSKKKSSSINSSSYKTQSIASISPLFKSSTDSDFNNWDIDIISSKIKKLSSIDCCSETSETSETNKTSKCITDKTSTKFNKGDFTPSNSNSNFNWELMEKQTKKPNNTIKIEKNNISITIDESNNIKIKFI